MAKSRLAAHRGDSCDALLARILGRSESLFAADMARHGARLQAAIEGRRVLVVGAAGSIGSAFVKAAAQFGPATLDLIDIDENGLVELIRELRSSPSQRPVEIRTATIDFGGDEFQRFTAQNAPYHVLTNFAALKHVRAERDVFSLLRMVDVNVGSLDRCLARSEAYGLQRVFSVSTDKSVRPANLMGATKNLMEKALFSRPGAFVATSARFANVAFSAGSLLEGFENRLAKGQPLAAPTDVRRYFISQKEAAQLCLLACFLGQDRDVFFPKLDAATHLISFPEIAEALLSSYGLRPLRCASEEEARSAEAPPGFWPCYFAPTDTSGEKSEEEFFRPDDIRDLESFAAVGIVREHATSRRTIDAFLEAISAIRAAPSWKKSQVIAVIRAAVPELTHVERERDLDQKM